MAVEEKAPVQEELAQPEEPGEPEALAQSTEQATVDITNLFNTESDRGGDIVTKKTMTINYFMLGARQAKQ